MAMKIGSLSRSSIPATTSRVKRMSGLRSCASGTIKRKRSSTVASKPSMPPTLMDALPGGGAVVVVARHPAEAGIVSSEFGERGRAGNGIRHVIVAAVGMRDGVPANRVGATLKPYDFALKAIIARQDDAATVREERSAVLSCKETNATKIPRQKMSQVFRRRCHNRPRRQALLIFAGSSTRFPHEAST
jgi:hypothetical protein